MLDAAVGGRAARGGARRLGLARDARPTGTRRTRPTSPGRVRGVAPRAARPAAGGRARRSASSSPRRRGTRRTTSSPRRRAAWPGPVLVATSDRDAYQLVERPGDDPAPTRGVSELARIGPAEVRERYGVEPEQVPDFIALRGDPSDKIPGARGVGPKKAAEILQRVRHARGALAAGGSRRRRRTCASTGESPRWTPPLPFLPSRTRHPPGRRRLTYVRKLGLGRCSPDRLALRRAIERTG